MKRTPHTTAALDAIRDTAVASDGVLGRATSMLGARRATLAEQLEKVAARETIYRKRLEKQYGALDAKLAACKATQSYLDQQIERWNNLYKN